jgi:hypothetical protein
MKSDTYKKNTTRPKLTDKSELPCPADRYRPDPLINRCLFNCSSKGMVNCGPLACGVDSASCQDTNKEMTAETAMSVAQGASFVMSFATAGASSSITVGIAAAKSAIKKASKDALLKGAKRSFKFIKKEMKNLVKKAAKDIR